MQRAEHGDTKDGLAAFAQAGDNSVPLLIIDGPDVASFICSSSWGGLRGADECGAELLH